MGGIGFGITIERTSKSAITPLALHTLVWNELGNAFGWLRKPGNRVTTSEYLWDAAYQGLREGEGGEWDQSETRLGFMFRDMAGCCNLSCEASLHWTRMSFAKIWNRIVVPGWTIIGPEQTIETDLAFGPSYPLVYTRRGMFAVVRRVAGKPLGDDDTEAGFGDSTRLDWAQLKGKDRDAVEWSALTGHCQCEICVRYRSVTRTPKERYKVPAEIGFARAAWDLLDGGEQRELEAEAAAKVRAWNWTERSGPVELEVLSDWLVKREAPLPIDALAGMVANRARQR